MDYPGAQHLELTEGCIASCTFCPHSQMNRNPKARMDEALFRRIIDEAATWPVAPRILPFMTSEPFQNKRLVEQLLYVNERLPASEITFFTIGALFTEALLERLESVRNIAAVFLSLHHYDPLLYNTETGLNHEQTLRSIDRFLRWNEAKQVVREVTLLRVSDGNQDHDRAFHEFCGRRFPSVRVVCSWRWNWKGDIASYMDVESTLNHVCGRHQTFHVLADGRSALCCLDQKGEHGYGDVNTETILSLYNSSRARFLRTHTKRDGGTPCDGCSMQG